MPPVIAAYNFCQNDFDSFLRNAAAAGFQHVGVGFMRGYLDLAPEDLSADDEALLKGKLAGHGLGIVAIFAGCDLLAQDGADLLKRKLDAAARFGVSILDTGSFGFDGKTPEQIAADTRTFVDAIRDCADHAGKLGITICLETHGGYTGTLEACLQAMGDIAHPRVRIAYDPANFLYYEGVRPEIGLDELLPFIGHTHLKDHRGGKLNNDFPLIGEGEVNYESLLPRLLQGGYPGPYTLERAPGATDAEHAQSLARAYALITRLLS